MNCLQKHFEEKQFKQKHEVCAKEISKFTELESKDTKLNRLLTQACHPVIQKYCNASFYNLFFKKIFLFK